MAAIKDFEGLYRRGAKKAWRIKWPISGEHYVYFGSRKNLDGVVKEVMQRAGRTVRPSVSELHNI